MFATPYMRINYTARHNDFFVIGRDRIYRQTIKVRWERRHSSAFKKGCWIQGNKISKCLVTLCIPRPLPGSMGAGDRKCLLPNRFWNFAVLAILLLHYEKSFPHFSEKGDFKTSCAHCSASYNDALKLLRSVGWIHPFTYHWALGKQCFHYLRLVQGEI